MMNLRQDSCMYPVYGYIGPFPSGETLKVRQEAPGMSFFGAFQPYIGEYGALRGVQAVYIGKF
jgi:hypothetical protein